MDIVNRCAEDGDHICNTILVGYDNVGIPFHHQCLTALAYGIERNIDSVELFAFGKYKRLW